MRRNGSQREDSWPKAKKTKDFGSSPFNRKRLVSVSGMTATDTSFLTTLPRRTMHKTTQIKSRRVLSYNAHIGLHKAVRCDRIPNNSSELEPRIRPYRKVITKDTRDDPERRMIVSASKMQMVQSSDPEAVDDARLCLNLSFNTFSSYIVTCPR